MLIWKISNNHLLILGRVLGSSFSRKAHTLLSSHFHQLLQEDTKAFSPILFWIRSLDGMPKILRRGDIQEACLIHLRHLSLCFGEYIYYPSMLWQSQLRTKLDSPQQKLYGKPSSTLLAAQIGPSLTEWGHLSRNCCNSSATCLGAPNTSQQPSIHKIMGHASASARPSSPNLPQWVIRHNN